MNDPAPSLPQTIPQPPPPSDDPPPAAGTVPDPYGTADLPPAPPTEAGAELPRVLGFQMEKELARGGMGVVFQARDTTMNRTVAVKVLQEKYTPDSPVAGRFLEEAQITGQLQHPGIPPIYQVGQLADGRPFLAMKLIKGETLDAKIKRGDKINYLALTEAIAQAVGYAHAHGVIHRDLKPQNIMVGAFGEVQVMDWGLAKLLTASGTASTSPAADMPLATTMYNPRTGIGSSETQAGSVLGTPAYMAPEQAAGEIGKIDTRSDVFGLGGVLCCMLTGQPPYTGPDPFAIMVNASRGKTEEAFARLDACGAEPEVIALCKRCLAFEPVDRPTDGNAVAQEVAALRAAAEERAKQAEIERARAEVIAAEQRKRRKVWFALAASLLVGLLASFGLAAWALHAEGLARNNEEQAKTERDQKEVQRQRADAERTEAVEQKGLADAVRNFLKYDVLLLADPATQYRDQASGLKYDADVKLRDVVLRASKAIEGKFSTQPLVEAELRWTIGATLMGMGRADLAIAHFARVHSLHSQQFGPDHPTTLASMGNVANSYTDLGRHADAHKLREETLARLKAKLGPDHPDTLTSMHNLAGSYADLGRHAEALKLNEETLGLSKAKLGLDHPSTLMSMHNLATSYAYLGRHAEALKLLGETLALSKAKLGPDHPRTLDSMMSQSYCYVALGRHAEALRLQEETLALCKAKLGPDHPRTLDSMYNLAGSYDALGRRAEALKLMEETLALMKAKLGPDHRRTLDSMNNVALSYAALGRHAEALKLYQEAGNVREKWAAREPNNWENLVHLGGLHCNIGNSLREETEFADSLTAYGRAMEHLQTVLRHQPQAIVARLFLRNTHWGRAVAYEKLQRYAEADADWAKAIELSPEREKASGTKVRENWKAKRKPPAASGKP